MVHIGEFLVLSAHSPDERIILRSDTGVDRPRGRNNSLLVMHNDMSCFLGLAHHMKYRVVSAHIEIEVNLHTSVMGVARHGVPVRANLKLGKTHSKLAGLHNLGMYVLIDNSLITVLNRAAGHLARLCDVYFRYGIFGVSGAGGHIELCGSLGVNALGA